MLTQDQSYFERTYHSAAAFTRAAALRYECFSILGLSRKGATPWQAERVRELLKTPACREPWFLDMVERDFGVVV